VRALIYNKYLGGCGGGMVGGAAPIFPAGAII